MSENANVQTATEFYIGKRLSYDGQLCTVRYRGEVKGTKGEWLGVEWDDPTRGKHSGEHAGVRYFECLSRGAASGSFIRPARKSDTPRSFSEALKAKYASEAFEDPSVQIVFATKPGDNVLKKDPLARINQPIRISGKEVEEVGFDKIRKQLAQLSDLKIVILDGLRIERSIARLRDDTEGWQEGLTDVKEACPKAIELDLSRNLFEEWREVASICEQLEKLKSLRVEYAIHGSRPSLLQQVLTSTSGTRFRDTTVTDNERSRCLKAFANITDLKLEENLLSWEDLTRITHLFPTLTTLSASSNLYTNLTPQAPNPNLTSLTLEDNALTSLSSVAPLTALPALRRLILKSNKVSSIISSPSSQLPIFSPTLTEVDLSYNDIPTWSFIDTLPTVFPGLTSLRVSHNPLYAHLRSPDGRALTPEDGYMLTVARLGCLKILNYSPITPKERLNAESYYLSLIAKEAAFAPASDEAAILAAHPRYKWLCEEYGEPVIQRLDGRVNPNSLAARLVLLKLYMEGGKTVELEVPGRCTAYTLIGMVSREYKVKPTSCRLVWETGDWVPAPRAAEVEDEEWDSASESEDEDEDEKEKPMLNSVMREVEIVPGTRSVGTWIEGMEATVRVEIR
ncbi:hypothetical protein N0V90_006786 [Kalmusia sp. IMI 367209]|nr:hypothetical protein N0V90_006786 [Kalmusia sp. IMI 367209]